VERKWAEKDRPKAVERFPLKSPETESEQSETNPQTATQQPRKGRLIVAQHVVLGMFHPTDLVPKGRLRISQDEILGVLLLHANALAPTNP
jgi:hypothetical protein